MVRFLNILLCYRFRIVGCIHPSTRGVRCCAIEYTSTMSTLTSTHIMITPTREIMGTENIAHRRQIFYLNSLKIFFKITGHRYTTLVAFGYFAWAQVVPGTAEFKPRA